MRPLFDKAHTEYVNGCSKGHRSRGVTRDPDEVSPTDTKACGDGAIQFASESSVGRLPQDICWSFLW